MQNSSDWTDRAQKVREENLRQLNEAVDNCNAQCKSEIDRFKKSLKQSSSVPEITGQHRRKLRLSKNRVTSFMRLLKSLIQREELRAETVLKFRDRKSDHRTE